ncbi:MAG TPA: hypothetical protein VGI10_12505 [Polyangiaceae bacterium]|jgi:hypothetical protein
MSGPVRAPSGAPPTGDDRPSTRYPEELSAAEREQLTRSRVVDAEAYMRWLETGEGPDPWDASSG